MAPNNFIGFHISHAPYSHGRRLMYFCGSSTRSAIGAWAENKAVQIRTRFANDFPYLGDNPPYLLDTIFLFAGASVAFDLIRHSERVGKVVMPCGGENVQK